MQADKENKKQTHSVPSSKHQEDSGHAEKRRSSDHAARAISMFHNTNSYNIFWIIVIIEIIAIIAIIEIMQIMQFVLIILIILIMPIIVIILIIATFPSDIRSLGPLRTGSTNMSQRNLGNPLKQ